MEAKKSSWWQYIRKHWIVAIIIALLIAAMVLILVESLINGTGFNGYNQVTIAHTNSGPSAGTVVRTEVSQPGKTLWDWLQLLIIPIVIAVAGYVINLTISRGEQAATEQRAKSEREATEKRAETEREIAQDNQREAALQAYIDKMSELLLTKQLADELLSNPQVKSIARARTVTILRILAPVRRGSLIRFLSQAEILTMCIEYELKGIDLHGGDLDGVNLSAFNLLETDLSKASLNFANLSGALLEGADFTDADLFQADLSRARLDDANLSGAFLREANLSGAVVTEEQLKEAASLKGAIMPKGDIHP